MRRPKVNSNKWQSTNRQGFILFLLLSSAIISAQDLDDGHLYVNILRGGITPGIAAAGETVEYRVDYEWRRPDAQRLELAPGVDWSPLVVESYRYVTNAQGNPSFRVVLRIPESLINTNGSDRWLFFTPQLRVVDSQGNGHLPYYSPNGFLEVLVRHALAVSTNGTIITKNEPPGSWWVVVDPSLAGYDSESPLRDRSRVQLPPGGELLIGGLDPRIVNWMVSDMTLNWPEPGTFVVRTEGPFELFPYDNPRISFQEYRTRSIPFIQNLFSFTQSPKLEWWKIGVRPRRGTAPGATGKVMVSWELGNGEEWSRRELRLETIPEPLESFGAISTNDRWISEELSPLSTIQVETKVFKSISISGLQVLPEGGYRAIFYANGQRDDYGSTNSIKSYTMWRLGGTNAIEFTKWYNYGTWSSCMDGSDYILGGAYTCEYIPVNYYGSVTKWTFWPGVVIATYPPFSGDWENIGDFSVPWSYEINRRYRCSVLTPVNIRVRFAPPAKLEYFIIDGITLSSVIQIDSSEIPGKPRNNTAITGGYTSIDTGYVYSYSPLVADLLSGRLNGEFDIYFAFASGLGGSYLTIDKPINTQIREENPEINVELLANPSALRLEHLGNTNRPWIELIVQADNDGEPWSAQPVVVEAPNAGLLALEEPRQTDRYGHYTFHWQPPGPDWFEGKPLPQRFWFTARLPGGRSASAVVEVAQRVLHGQVVRRHAGADRDDPDGDGLSPVAGAQVSLTPDFNPDLTSQTDSEGRFSIAVPDTGTYTVYVRKPGNQPPMTLTHSSHFLVTAGETEVNLTEPLYLASLSVLNKLKTVYLPQVSDFLQASPVEMWLQIDSPTNPAPAIDAFLQRLQTQTQTASYDEEALRRLNLAVWTAYEGSRAAQEVAEFAADQIWEGSFAALNRLMVEALEKINLVQTLKDNLNKQIQQLIGSGGDSTRLKQLKDQLAMLERAETKFVEVKRRINQAAYSLYSQIAVRLAKSGPDSRTTKRLFLQLVKYWNDRMLEYAGDQVEDWLLKSKLGQLTVQETSRRLQSVSDSLSKLDTDLRQALKQYLALGFRQEVARALLEATEAASAGRFPQRPYSYAAAQRAVDLAMEQLQAEINRFRSYLGSDLGYNFWMDFVNGVIDDWNGWAKATSVAVSGGTLAQGVAIADRILEAVDRLLPVVQVVNGVLAVQSIDEDGAITVATVKGIRFALSQAGRFQVRVHSPVHLMAVDSLGRRTGFDTEGTLYQEIPSAFAHPVMGDQPETIYLPEAPSSYRLLVQGIGTGSYLVEAVTEQADGGFQTNSAWSAQATPNTVRSVPLEVTGQAVSATGAEAPLPVAQRLEIWDDAGRSFNALSLSSGEIVRIRPVLLGEDQFPLPTEPTNFQFTVSNTNALTFRQEGIWWEIAAGLAGTSTLSVSHGSQATNLSIVVTTAPPSVLTLQLSPAVAQPGTTVQLEARVTDGFNNLSGWTVQFLAPTRQTNAIATAITGADGYARATWTLPTDLSESVLVVATLQRPDGLALTAARRVGVPFAAEALPGTPVNSETNLMLVITNGLFTVRVQVPSEAFPDAMQPVAFLETMPVNLFPQPDGEWGFISDPVSLTLLDAARETEVQANKQFGVIINLTNRDLSHVYVWYLVKTNGTYIWQSIDSAILTTNGLQFNLDQSGVVVLAADVRPPYVTETQPTDGAYFVNRSQPLTIRFHEPVVPGSSWTQIRVEVGTNQVPVQTTIAGDQLIVTPQRIWLPGQQHRLVVPEGTVTDATGNPNYAFTLKFTSRPAQRPRLQKPVIENTENGLQVRLRFATEPDLGYVLEETENLFSGDWAPVWTSPIPVNTTETEAYHVVPNQDTQKFYRIRVVW
jgi:hypothetical protein